MWQLYKGKWHFLITGSGRIEEGRLLESYCQEQIRKNSWRKTDRYPLERRCGICSGVSQLINTSVEEARRYSLPKENRLVVLYRAHELTTSKALRKAIESRIRKVSDADDSDSQKEKAI